MKPVTSSSRRHPITTTSTILSPSIYVNKIHGLLADVGISKKVKPLSVGGRELLVSLYYMLDREEVYDPPGVSS